MIDEDFDFHKNKRPDKTYVSKRIDGGLRIASKVMDCESYVHELKLRDEIVLRSTPGGRQEIIAKFYEHDRRIHVLTMQRWNCNKGRPYEKQYFSFINEEIVTFLNFIHSVTSLHFPDAEKINLPDASMRSVTTTPEIARALLKADFDLVAKIIEDEVTQRDVVALAYRRKQLLYFERLIGDAEFFQSESKGNGAEALWQSFFESNTWIFGYGLSYVVLDPLEGKRLEQTIRGFNLANSGKRADALMKTRAEVSSLCFVEIKHHDTALVGSRAYRPGVWSPSAELVGGVTQLQETVRSAAASLSDPFRPKNDDGSPTGETLYGFEPRSFLVVGHLSQFKTADGLNEEKFRSFELFRRNLRQPEIVTFDELLYRARFIVEGPKASARDFDFRRAPG